jgi:hypothetical protein
MVTKGDQNIMMFTTFRMKQIHTSSHALVGFILIPVWTFWKTHIPSQIEKHKKPNTSTQMTSSESAHTVLSFSWFQTFIVLWTLYFFFLWFPGTWILCADVSEHSVSSIFISRVNNKNNWGETLRVFIQVYLYPYEYLNILVSVILLVQTTYEDGTECSETS